VAALIHSPMPAAAPRLASHALGDDVGDGLQRPGLPGDEERVAAIADEVAAHHPGAGMAAASLFRPPWA
jgi:hypothetical protein